MAEPSAVEKLKAASRGLRGTLAAGLADPSTGALADGDAQLLRLHGSYQQDDRDRREERRLQKLEPLWRFMVRLRLPGGVCSAAQWLAIERLARAYAGSTLRLTTRQTFQFHGIVKQDLKPTLAALNAALIDTIATCGDVNRNVVASSATVESPAHAAVADWARRLSELLLPRTRAYHEIWLDGEKLAGEPEPEPLYGATYLPRKFKMALAIPPVNDVDVFANDVGFIAIVEHGALAGFNLTLGGGLGATHGDAATYPRLADVAGFLPEAALPQVATAVLETQRDFGDRSNRKHARLKYTLADRGLEWFVAEVERRAQLQLQPPRAFHFDTNGDRYGWRQGYDGRWHRTLCIPAGRISDRYDLPWLAGLGAIAASGACEFRLTPNQNVTLAGVDAGARAGLDAVITQFRLDAAEHGSPLKREALACVALPTCPLAMAEAERYLPQLTGRLEALLERHGLAEVPVSVRVTGCPNGCARSYLAEIGLIGKAPGRYNLHLGGGVGGERLNVLYRENLDEAGFLGVLDELLGEFAAERESDERFGDFLWRSGRLPVAGGAVRASS